MAGVLVGHLDLRPPHRRRLLLRRLHGAARPHRRAPARHRRTRRARPSSGEPVQAVHPGLRPRRPEDRRGRPDARRPAGAAAPAGELPARHGDHADAVGAAGDLAAAGGGAGAAAGGHRAVRHAAQRAGARPRGARAGAAARRPSTGVYLLRAARRRAGDVHGRPAGERRHLRLRRRRRCRCSSRRASTRCVYYVASAELFDLLPAGERRRIFPEERAREAMGITGFTLPTMYRWVRSEAGLAATLHPFATATSWAAARARWCSRGRPRRRQPGAGDQGLRSVADPPPGGMR